MLEPIPANVNRDSDEYVFFTGTRGPVHYFKGVRFTPEDAPLANQHPKGSTIAWEVRCFDGTHSEGYGIFKEWQAAMDFAVRMKVNWRNQRNFRVNRCFVVELSEGEFYMIKGRPIEWSDAESTDPYYDGPLGGDFQ